MNEFAGTFLNILPGRTFALRLVTTTVTPSRDVVVPAGETLKNKLRS